MLTENPARKFGVQGESDPAADITAFSRVRYTIRSGRIIYRSR